MGKKNVHQWDIGQISSSESLNPGTQTKTAGGEQWASE